jgi:CBS domain-containing protein
MKYLYSSTREDKHAKTCFAKISRRSGKEKTNTMKVKDVMTTNVITVKEDQTRQQAASLMSRHRISGLPVINAEGTLLGVITEYDILAKKGNGVRDLMTQGGISVAPETEIEEANHILIHDRIKRLLVLDEGRLVGIVSRGDLVREIATRWVCHVCGEITHSDFPPTVCPRCNSPELVASPEPAPPGS